MESFSIAPPGRGSRSRNSDDPLLGRCDAGAVAAGVRFHHWGLGFRQCSFRLITRASRDDTVSAFRWLPLLWHALFPSSFRLQVNQMAQKHPSEFLLTASGIQHRVPRRTLSPHPAFQIEPGYSRRADQTSCLFVPGTHQGIRLTRPPTYLLFPVRSVDSCLDATAGTP